VDWDRKGKGGREREKGPQKLYGRRKGELTKFINTQPLFFHRIDWKQLNIGPNGGKKEKTNRKKKTP